MGSERSASTEDEHRSDASVVRIRCECGDWLGADTRKTRVSCECGQSFAVTVTGMFSESSSTTD